MTLHYLLRRRILWLSLCSFFFALLAWFMHPGFFHQATAEAESEEVGYRDFSFGSTYAPTAAETQSKLWFNDGIWWGSLFNPTTEQFEIHRFDAARNSWITTGTLIDPRKVSRADCLWNGEYLYIASAVRLNTVISNQSIRILRYRYDFETKQYVLDAGFPVLLTQQATYGIVLDQDTTGALWVTYTAMNSSGGSSVYVSHSNPEGTQWTTPYVLPVHGTSDLLSEEISALVAFDGQVGVMWSNQNHHTMYFATHKDGDPDDQWKTSAPLQGMLLSDNHIQLKSFQTDSGGRVFAAVKTSLNDGDDADPNDPLLVLLELNPNGSWTKHTFGRVSERHTRPLILIDEERQTLYLFATSFCCGNGRIYYKHISLKDVNAQFPEGLGDLFLQFGEGSNVNNTTSTKQPVNSKTGVLVLAEDGNFYVHNRIGLVSTSPPVAGPPGEQVVTRVMFPFIAKNSLHAP